MRFYQIKSTEKGSAPPRWYRLLVPSGITFSQLYVLLAYVHGELYFMSSYFSFETKDRNIIVEEFEDGEPGFGHSFADTYDSVGTYIDTLFSKGFRISLYTGTDFDLTIEVEKDAAEYPELRAPQIIKVSRAVAEEEGGQPQDETLPEEMFGIEESGKREFAFAEELAERAESGSGTIMYVSADPVTPEESIVKGRASRNHENTQKIMEPLREDKDLGPLIREFDDLDEYDSSKRYLLAKINNLMIKKYGETFADYVTYRMIGMASPELADLFNSVNEKSYYRHGAQALADAYSKEDLLAIADEYDVRVPQRAIVRTISKKLATALFNVESILSRMLQLDDTEMELMRKVAGRDAGWYPETDAELEDADQLQYLILAFELEDGRVFAPDEVRHTYAANWNEDMETGRKKRVWMKACLTIAEAFYGVMSWDVLGRLFARKFKNQDPEELKKIFRELPDHDNIFIEYDGRLILRGYEEDDYYKYLEKVIQQDKPFYIPSRREIEEFSEKGCLLSSQSHQAMYRFLVNTLGINPKMAELQVEIFYNMINNERRMQEAVDSLEDLLGEDGAFRSEEDVRKFAELYMNMNNFSHLQANRGYTPNDLFQVTGGAKGLPQNVMISPRGPEAADLLDQARDELSKMGISLDEDRVQEMLKEEKRKKIGRNEPCPCGSGKKYKNCCGKK